MYCPKCGTENQDNNFKCTKCGEVLHPSSPRIVIASDDTLGGMMPTKNGPPSPLITSAFSRLSPSWGFRWDLPH
jgi:hypothetical protein